MSGSAVIDIDVPNEVIAEVHRKLEEVEFNAFRETVFVHFPDALAIQLRMLEDPDEEDRCWVVFEVRLPRDLTSADYSNEIKTFYSELSQRRSHMMWPICVLRLRWGGGA